MTLPVTAWYPATDAGTGIVVYTGSPYLSVTGDGQRDGTADCTESRPVMVHSHGSTSIRWEMFYLMEFMATHGWVIAAPDHVGNTHYSTYSSHSSLLRRRPADISDTFDWLVDQSADSSSPLFGCVDPTEGYVASGYSFGGYTAFVLGGAAARDWTGVPIDEAADARVNAVVTHAAWSAFGAIGDGTEAMTVPVMTVGGARDATAGTAYLRLHNRVSSTPRALASFPDGGHYSGTAIYCIAWGDGCGPYYVDTTLYESIVKTSVLAFLEHVRGAEGAWEQLVEDSGVVEWETAL